jgi:hypothetical protein
VISKNLQRRHLDESQRAWVGSKVENFKHGGDRKSHDQNANWQVDRTTASTMLNVSERSIARAAVVRDNGTPELQEAVAQGQLPVSVARTRRPVLCQAPPRRPHPSPRGAADERASETVVGWRS